MAHPLIGAALAAARSRGADFRREPALGAHPGALGQGGPARGPQLLVPTLCQPLAAGTDHGLAAEGRTVRIDGGKTDCTDCHG